MFPRLQELSRYTHYFQFTITPYDHRLEPNLPEKRVLVQTFIELSRKLGPNRVIWRYDPILLTAEYSIDFHIGAFSEMAYRLGPHTRKCVISFLDLYRKSQRNLYTTELVDLTHERMRMLAKGLAQVAHGHGIEMTSCAEEIDLTEFGITHGQCIDSKLIAEIGGYELDISKDKTQRAECGCVASIDIGAYNTCPHGCLYCYANFDARAVKMNLSEHDPEGDLLFGKLCDLDKVTDRKVLSCRVLQQRLL